MAVYPYVLAHDGDDKKCGTASGFLLINELICLFVHLCEIYSNNAFLRTFACFNLPVYALLCDLFD